MLLVPLWGPTLLSPASGPLGARLLTADSVEPGPPTPLFVLTPLPVPAPPVETLSRLTNATAGTDLVALLGRRGAGIAPPARARFPAGGDASRGREGEVAALVPGCLLAPWGTAAAGAAGGGALDLNPLQVAKWAEPCLLHTQRLHSLQAIKPVLALRWQPTSRQCGWPTHGPVTTALLSAHERR
jgi:hypothetical protein